MLDVGFTKRHRKRWRAGYHKDHLLWVMMDYLIDNAAFEEHSEYIQGVGKINLKRGESYYTIRTLADTLGASVRQIRTRMNTLQTIEFLTQEPTHKGTKVFIINYDLYQTIEPQGDTANDTDATQYRHSTDTLLYKRKEGKEGKEQRKVTSVTSSPPSGGNGHPPPCPHQKIVSLYNQICTPHGLPEIRSWDNQASKWLVARWREDKQRQNIDWWEWFFKNEIITSAFLTGKKKDWTADLRWIVRPSNFAKILNGNYVNRGPNTGSARTDQNIRIAEEVLREREEARLRNHGNIAGSR